MDGCMGRRIEERWREGSLREGDGWMMGGWMDGWTVAVKETGGTQGSSDHLQPGGR